MRSALAGALVALLLLGGCRPDAPPPVPIPESAGVARPVSTPGIDALAATVEGAGDRRVTGVVVLAAGDGTLILAAALDGLELGPAYTVHVHRDGDCSAADATSAGPVFELPGDSELAAVDDRRAGRFGAFEPSPAGQAKFSIERASPLKPAVFSGRSVVVHADAGGGGGRRVACGVLRPVAR